MKAIQAPLTIAPFNPGMIDMQVVTHTVPVASTTTAMPSLILNHSILGIQPTTIVFPEAVSDVTITKEGGKATKNISLGSISNKIQRGILNRYHTMAGHYSEADKILKNFSSNPQEALNDLNNEVIWGSNKNKLRREQLEKVRPAYIERMQSHAVPASDKEWLDAVGAMSALIGIGDEISIDAVLNFVKEIPLQYRKATDILATRLLAYQEQYSALQDLMDYRAQTEEWSKMGDWENYHAFNNSTGIPYPQTTVVVYLDLERYLHEIRVTEVQFPHEIFQTLSFNSNMIQDVLYNLSGVLDASPVFAVRAVSWTGTIPTVPTFDDSMFWLDQLIFE